RGPSTRFRKRSLRMTAKERLLGNSLRMTAETSRFAQAFAVRLSPFDFPLGGSPFLFALRRGPRLRQSPEDAGLGLGHLLTPTWLRIQARNRLGDQFVTRLAGMNVTLKHGAHGTQPVQQASGTRLTPRLPRRSLECRKRVGDNRAEIGRRRGNR